MRTTDCKDYLRTLSADILCTMKDQYLWEEIQTGEEHDEIIDLIDEVLTEKFNVFLEDIMEVV